MSRLLRLSADLIAFKAPFERVRPGQLVAVQQSSGAEDKIRAAVLCERAGTLLAAVMPSAPGASLPSIKEGAEASVLSGEFAFAPVGDGNLLGGRAIDCHGNLLDNQGAPAAEVRSVARFGEAASQAQLKPIERSLHTGTLAIDSLTPVGRGQSMMLFGLAGTGKSSIGWDALLAQNRACDSSPNPVHTVLALSDGGAERACAALNQIRAHDDSSLSARCTIVSAVRDSAADRFLTLCTAASVGEAVRDAGGDALVIADELRGMCELWDLAGEAVQALGGPQAGLHADRKDNAQQRIFYASYLQRCAQLNEANGGGSLTLLGMLRQAEPPAGRSAGPAKGANGSATSTPVAGTAEADTASGHLLVYSAADFAAHPKAQRARVEALSARGIAIDDAVLAKLGIRPPAPPPKPVAPEQSADATKAPAPGMLSVPLVPSVPPTAAPEWPLPQGHLSAEDRQLAAARRSVGHTDQLTSLADGHIQLQRHLFEANRRPATLPTDSLARVGAGSDLSEARAQPSTRAMRQVAQYLRLELAQAKDLLPPSPHDSALIKHQRTRAGAVQAVLCRHAGGRPLRLSHQVTLLHALAAGHLDHLANASDEAVAKEMGMLLDHVERGAGELLAQVDATGELDGSGAKAMLALAAEVLPESKGRAFFTNYDRSTWSKS